MGTAGTDGDWAEADWRLVAESIPHIVWVADGHGRTLYFNERGIQYSGVTPDAVTWAELVHPDDLEHAAHCWENARSTSTTFMEDVRLRRADGTYLWHSARSQPVLDAEGRIERWFGTATDVDDRKQVEAHLIVAQRETLAAMELLTELQAAAPVGFGFADRDLRIVRMNDALATFARLSMPDDLGRTLAEVVPDVWGRLEPVCQHVLRTGEPVRNLPMSRPGSEEAGRPHREGLISFYPVRLDDEVVGVGVIVVDITERLQAEGFRSTVMSQVADGVYTQDLVGALTYMNRAASKMLGWTEDELRGRCMHDVVHAQRADGTRLAAADCALLAEGSDHRLVRVAGEAFTRKDGSMFPVAYSSMPLQVGSRVDGVTVVFRDISDPGTATTLVRVLIADADRASTDAVTAMLTRHEGLVVVGVAATAPAAVDMVSALRPDVVLIDLELPPAGGAATTLQVRAASPSTSVILLGTDYDEAAAAGAIAAGCSGIVDKRRAWVDLASAVRAAYHGETTISQVELQRVVTSVRDSWKPGRAEDLTTREREVLRCLTQGLSNQQVALRLHVTVNTVRNHVQRILYKLDVHSRLEAVVLATKGGLLDGPG